MNNILTKVHELLKTCHPDDKEIIELDYYELSKIYSALKAQELYNTTREKCLMDGFDKMDNPVQIESPSNDEYLKLAEESNIKIRNSFKIPEHLL